MDIKLVIDELLKGSVEVVQAMSLHARTHFTDFVHAAATHRDRVELFGLGTAALAEAMIAYENASDLMENNGFHLVEVPGSQAELMMRFEAYLSASLKDDHASSAFALLEKITDRGDKVIPAALGDKNIQRALFIHGAINNIVALEASLISVVKTSSSSDDETLQRL